MMKGVFFDLGLTLIYPSIVEDAVQYLKEMGYSVSMDSMEKAVYRTDQYFFKYYPGVLNQPVENFFPWYAEVLIEFLEIQISIPLFASGMLKKYPPRSRWLLYEDTIPTLKRLSCNGYQLGLITNWDLSARRVIEELGIMPYLHTVIVSSEEGYEKPDKKIFTLALEHSKLEPSQLLYIGDNYRDDIQGAKRVGIEGILIDRYSKYREETSDFDCQEIQNLKEVIDLLL